MSLKVHSLRIKKMFYVRDTIKKPVKNLTFGKGLEKVHVGPYISCVTARPIRVMWQSRRAAKSTQSQNEKKNRKQRTSSTSP